MTSITDLMENVLKSLKDVLVTGSAHRAPVSDDIEDQAMAAIQNDEGFSNNDLAYAATVIEDPKCAKMYLWLKGKGAYRVYILHQMAILRGN
jgi:hypothetical protein